MNEYNSYLIAASRRRFDSEVMSPIQNRPCPICQSTNISALGSILHPSPALVAGVPLELGETCFRLLRCSDCTFQFKDPVINAERLMACYSAAESDNWEESPDPWIRRFDTIRSVVERHAPKGRLLDVGCFNGAMLDYFGDRWQRFGIEPSAAAAELARKRGINILSRTLEELPADAGSFDAVIAIDVLEHLVEPLPFFRLASAVLQPGGVFIALTGNTNALAWKLQGSMYWYCSLPEHVSFFNVSSMATAGGQVGLGVVECIELGHKRLPISRKASDLAKSAVYVAARAVSGVGRRGPSIQTARDHLLCVLRKH